MTTTEQAQEAFDAANTEATEAWAEFKALGNPLGPWTPRVRAAIYAQKDAQKALDDALLAAKAARLAAQTSDDDAQEVAAEQAAYAMRMGE